MKIYQWNSLSEAQQMQLLQRPSLPQHANLQTETAACIDAKPESHSVIMSNGMVITGVPVRYRAVSR